MSRKTVFYVQAIVLLLGGARARAQVYPPGFQDEFVVGGLQEPTTFLFTPDGRMLVAERRGRVRVVQNGALLSTPMLTLSVVTGYEQGLLGLALDPNFPSAPYLYVCYSHGGGSFDANRVSRWTVSGNAVVPGTEQVLLDGIPTGDGWHVAGCIRFAPSGHLFVSMGDGGNEPNVQQLGRLEGKLMRIEADGGIPPNNPFVGVPGARPEIYQLGLRNPFRFCIQPGTGIPFIGDVGYNSWEEVDAGPPGANFGWPGEEGMSTPPSPALTDPLYVYDHDLGSAAIAGNTFHPGAGLPAEYAGNYFFIDHVRGHLGRIVLGPNNSVVSANPRWIEVAATGWGSGPTELQVGPQGALYYSVYAPGSIRRIRYVGAVNASPTAFASASPTAGYAPLGVQFDAAGTFDPDGDPLAYEWSFGDGSPLGSGPAPLHTYTSNGTYQAALTVRDGRGGVTTAPSLEITVGNLPPVLEIVLPLPGTTFVAGDSIAFFGSGSDPEDGAVADSCLHWNVDLVHETHTHPVLADHVGSHGRFGATAHDEDLRTISYRVILWAEDATGLRAERSIDVLPDPGQFVYLPPAIASTPPLAAQVGVQYTYAASASGEVPLIWSLPVAPSWMHVTPAGLVSGMPDGPGVHDVHLQVRNAGGTALQTWPLVVAAGGSTPQTVVAIGTQWAYFAGSAHPGSGWADVAHDDAAWPRGPSGFGYGDGDDATVLAGMQGNYSTVFTRRRFEMVNADATTEIALRFDWDDGFAAYLNGTRFCARNAPATITNTSLATANHEATGTFERQAFTDPATLALLRDGENVLAVVGLNATLSSSDLTLRIELETTQVFTPAPTDAGLPVVATGAAPNPFGAGTRLTFIAARAGAARLDVFDIRGRRIRRVLAPGLRAGPQTLWWDGRDAESTPVPSGIYFYRLEIPGATIQSGKLVRAR